MQEYYPDVKLVRDDIVVFSYGEVAHFGGDDGVSERPLPLAGCASLSPEIGAFRE